MTDRRSIADEIEARTNVYPLGAEPPETESMTGPGDGWTPAVEDLDEGELAEREYLERRGDG